MGAISPGCAPMCVLMAMILPGSPATRGIPARCRRSPSGTLLGGGVSEWPKEHASKACEGVTPPRVQIPPPPLLDRPNTRPGFDASAGGRLSGLSLVGTRLQRAGRQLRGAAGIPAVAEFGL